MACYFIIPYIKVIMWKPIKRPKSLIGYEISTSGEIRDLVTKLPHPHMIYKDTKGYLCIKIDNIEYKIHRIVADHFIRKLTPKLEVHHKDLDKSNPEVSNLVVCTKKQHRRLHASTVAPVPCIPGKSGVTVLDEKTVHKICKLLEQDYTYPKIRETLELFNITDDAINKIAVGKNWSYISNQYNIKVDHRSCMNSYSEYAIAIAILMNRGYRVKEIAEVMGFEVKNNTDYQRLFKAATRYKNQFCEGKWGLFTKQQADDIVRKYTE